MPADATAFEPLVGDRLYAITFVLNDYVQLLFDAASINVYTPAVVKSAGQEYRWGDSGYRNALCERIPSTLVAGETNNGELELEFSDSSVLTISLSEAEAVGPEAAELNGPEGTWVWQAGPNPPVYFAKPS